MYVYMSRRVSRVRMDSNEKLRVESSMKDDTLYNKCSIRFSTQFVLNESKTQLYGL
jgi:hypothetical protein